MRMPALLVSCALSLVVVQPSFAEIISSPDIGVLAGGSGSSGYIWETPAADSTLNGTFAYSGESTTSAFDFNYDIVVDPDPFVSLNFAITNTTTTVQTFVVGVVLPISPPQVPATLMGGSVGLTLTDANFDGIAKVTDSFGTPLYQAAIDGVNVLPLWTGPFAASVVFAGQTISPNTVAGLPGPSISGPAAINTISILNTFTLTPGDRVTFSSFFVVQAVNVPEAGTMVMLGVATVVMGAGAGLRQWRKRASV